MMFGIEQLVQPEFQRLTIPLETKQNQQGRVLDPNFVENPQNSLTITSRQTRRV